MSNVSRAVVLVALLLLPACASITEGHSQKLTFESNPSGAQCTLTRNGETLGTVSTPGQFLVDKTKYGIDVTCAKDGYEDAKGFVKSDIESMTLGNAVLGGLIGWGIDSATGADNKYQEVTVVTFNQRKIPAAATMSSPSAIPMAGTTLLPTATSSPVTAPPVTPTPAWPPLQPVSYAGAPPKPPLPNVVGFKAPPVGLRIYPDAGGYYEVTSIDGAAVRTVNAALRPAAWIGPFVVPGADPQQVDWKQMERLWPLEIGKSAAFTISETRADGSRAAAWQEKITVLRQETIATDAGSFQTFVVETRERPLAGGSQAVVTSWYAPDIGFVVKYRRDVENGAEGSTTWTVARIISPGS